MGVYSPTLGRFMRRDPSGEHGGENANLYAYCKGDPINYNDPTGLDRVSIQWSEKEKRFDVYTIRQKFEIVTDGFSDAWKGAGEDEPVFRGSIDNDTGLVNMGGKFTTMQEFVKEAHRNGSWAPVPNNVGSNITAHFDDDWRKTHLFDKDSLQTMANATGLRGSLIGLNQLAFEQQMANAHTPEQKLAARMELDQRLNDVFEGTEIATQSLYQLMWFYMTAPLELAQATRVARSLSFADKIEYSGPQSLKASDFVRATKGFKTFDEFKEAVGPAGPGFNWHHIVEQGANESRFGAEFIHNEGNLIRLPSGKGSIHTKISAFYSSKPTWLGGRTVREVVSSMSYQQQWEFGIQVIKQFGGTEYLPEALR